MRAASALRHKSNPCSAMFFSRWTRSSDDRQEAWPSEREYALPCRISRGAVQKARQSGRLVLHAAARSMLPPLTSAGRRRPILRNSTATSRRRAADTSGAGCAVGAVAGRQGAGADRAASERDDLSAGAHRQRGDEARLRGWSAAEGRASIGRAPVAWVFRLARRSATSGEFGHWWSPPSCARGVACVLHEEEPFEPTQTIGPEPS